VAKLISSTSHFAHFAIEDGDTVEIGWTSPPPSYDPEHPVFEWRAPNVEWRIVAHTPFPAGNACNLPASCERADYLMLQLTKKAAHILRDKIDELLAVIEEGKPGVLERLPDGEYKITVPMEMQEKVMKNLAERNDVRPI